MIKPRLTYANVAATLALVFSMTGGALAAKHYLINSTKQINPKVIAALKGKTGPAGPQGLPGKEGPVGKEGLAGKEGKAGKEGEEGPIGPSDVYEVELSANTPIEPASTPRTLTLANLPAGSYAIIGKAVISPEKEGRNTSQCTLTAGSQSDQSWTPGSTVANYYITVNTQLTHTFTSTGNVTMSCFDRDEKWALVGNLARIMAVRVGSAHQSAAEAS